MTATPRDDAPDYDERLVVPPWLWPAALAVSLLLAAPVHGGAGGARAVVPYVVAPVLALVALVAASRGRITIDRGVLHVPGARAPLTAFGGATALDVEQTRRLRGPTADLRAHVAARPWLRRAVRIEVEDAADDTPYWLVTSARPEALAAAVERARLNAGGRAPSS